MRCLMRSRWVFSSVLEMASWLRRLAFEGGSDDESSRRSSGRLSGSHNQGHGTVQASAVKALKSCRGPLGDRDGKIIDGKVEARVCRKPCGLSSAQSRNP
jgi:hypothetical protein